MFRKSALVLSFVLLPAMANPAVARTCQSNRPEDDCDPLAPLEESHPPTAPESWNQFWRDNGVIVLTTVGVVGAALAGHRLLRGKFPAKRLPPEAPAGAVSTGGPRPPSTPPTPGAAEVPLPRAQSAPVETSRRFNHPVITVDSPLETHARIKVRVLDLDVPPDFLRQNVRTTDYGDQKLFFFHDPETPATAEYTLAVGVVTSDVDRPTTGAAGYFAVNGFDTRLLEIHKPFTTLFSERAPEMMSERNDRNHSEPEIVMPLLEVFPRELAGVL